MFISFVIPIYNVEKYLKQCLDSVIGQTYTDFEIICINDGSIDGSSLILHEYASNHTNFTLLYQENQGLSAARNAGIRAAKGDYVFFLDSDDWIEQDTIKRLLVKQNGEDMICFNGQRFFEDGTVENPDTGIIEEGLTGWEYYNRYALISRKFHFVCTVLRLYRREFLIQNSLFFEEGIYHEDNLFTPLACYYARTVKVIPDSLYIYRIRSGSITHSTSKKHILDTVKVANKLSVFFIPKTDIDKQTIYREIAGEYFKGFMWEERQNYGNNDKELSEQINWKCFRLVTVYPRHKRIYWLLRVYPQLFRMYLLLEQKLKNYR